MVFLRALLLLALIFEAQSCQTTTDTSTCTGPGCAGHDPNGLGGRMSIRRPSMVRIERLAFRVCDEDRDFGLSWEEVASCEVRQWILCFSAKNCYATYFVPILGNHSRSCCQRITIWRRLQQLRPQQGWHFDV